MFARKWDGQSMDSSGFLRDDNAERPRDPQKDGR